MRCSAAVSPTARRRPVSDRAARCAARSAHSGVPIRSKRPPSRAESSRTHRGAAAVARSARAATAYAPARTACRAGCALHRARHGLGRAADIATSRQQHATAPRRRLPSSTPGPVARRWPRRCRSAARRRRACRARPSPRRRRERTAPEMISVELRRRGDVGQQRRAAWPAPARSRPTRLSRKREIGDRPLREPMRAAAPGRGERAVGVPTDLVDTSSEGADHRAHRQRDERWQVRPSCAARSIRSSDTTAALGEVALPDVHQRGVEAQEDRVRPRRAPRSRSRISASSRPCPSNWPDHAHSSAC